MTQTARAALLVPVLVATLAIAAAPAPPPAADAADAAEPPAPTPIGWASVPGPVLAEADAANRAALERHRAGDYSGARAGFEEALAAAPEFALARYNLACALSRLGETEGAAAQLETLLTADLTHYRRRLDDDPDLEALRRSPHLARLHAHIDALLPRWRDAVARGVPAVAWRAAARAEAGKARARQLVRAGVLVPETHRFVPLGPRTPGAISALVDPAHERVVVVHGKRIYNGYDPLDGVRVALHPMYGDVGPHAEHAIGSMRAGNAPHRLQIYGTAAGARYRVAVDDDGSVRPFGAWRDLGPDGARHARDQTPPAGTSLLVVNGGS